MDINQLSTGLRSTISALHKMLRKNMAIATSYSMTEMETVGLILRNRNMLPTELAALTRITTQSMSQILKKLEEQGVIKRTPSLDDKRKVFVSITDHGTQMVEKMRYSRDEELKLLLNQLTAEEQQTLGKAVPVLNKLLELQNKR